jgi:NTP pyrophosphatase (non-canonical NTP hydrolase)
MTYYLYHIPGKKVGVTRDLEKRVIEQQGYDYHEFEILLESEDIDFISNMEIAYQTKHGYRVDETPYNKLKFNNKEMNINVTEQTTTFPCPINKLKGQLMDNKGMTWDTDHGNCIITSESIKWIMKNIQISRYNDQRCYVYNKALSRWFDNNDAYQSRDQYNGQTRTGALSPCGNPEYSKRKCGDCDCNINPTQFDLIRTWASDRGLYENGDPKTQALKLVEEVGETCRAILKDNEMEMVDGIGDCVVVLTNLAELIGTPIEECIEQAYFEIKNRKGKMANGTYVKD